MHNVNKKTKSRPMQYSRKITKTTRVERTTKKRHTGLMHSKNGFVFMTLLSVWLRSSSPRVNVMRLYHINHGVPTRGCFLRLIPLTGSFSKKAPTTIAVECCEILINRRRTYPRAISISPRFRLFIFFAFSFNFNIADINLLNGEDLFE